MFTILNLLIMRKNYIVMCRPMGDPWVPANPMGLGLGKILNPSRVWVVTGMGFLMSSNIFHGFGFGTAKPDGFRPVAIPTHRKVAQLKLWSL